MLSEFPRTEGRDINVSQGIMQTESAMPTIGKLELLLMRKLLDPTYLPSHYDIQLAFGQKGFKPEGLSKFCYKNRFEVVNREFISALGTYMATRIDAYTKSHERPINILEVGTGKGQLGFFLQKSLNASVPDSCKIFLTDNGKDGLETSLPVERMDVKEALAVYQPTIVLSSWMPLKEDWTPHFRSTSSVREYILIGDRSCCGTENETWCGQEDFERVFLEDISKLQISHQDQIRAKYDLPPPSETHSFRRKY